MRISRLGGQISDVTPVALTTNLHYVPSIPALDQQSFPPLPNAGVRLAASGVDVPGRALGRFLPGLRSVCIKLVRNGLVTEFEPIGDRLDGQAATTFEVNRATC